jgi:hypothetical protein
VPGTLVLDTDSSRADTLKATVHGTRGEGEVLFRSESFAEFLGGVAGLHVPPRGYQIVSLRIDRNSDRSYEVASIVADEIVRDSRVLRRGKPRTPISRASNDEIRTCVACGMRIMTRGSDSPGWKGIQMNPDVLAFDYYCIKPACVEKRDEAIERAKVNWGYAPAEPDLSTMKDTLPPPVPRGSEVEKEEVTVRMPPSKPFL